MNLIIKHRIEIGISLCLIAIPMALIIKELTGLTGIDWTNMIFLGGLLLIPNYKNLLHFRFPQLTSNMLVIVGYQIVVMIYALWKHTPLMQQGYGTIYTLFVIVFMAFLITNKRILDSEYFCKFIWGLSGAFSVCLMYILTDQLSNFNVTKFMRLETGGDRLSLSTVAFTYLVAMLTYKPKGMFQRLLQVLFTFSAIFDILSCNRRGLMVAYLIIICIFIYHNVQIKLTPKVLIRITIVCIAVIILRILMQKIQTGFVRSVNEYIESFTKAVGTYFGNTSQGIDAAAINRNNVWHDAPDKYINHSSFWQIIGGRGYNDSHLDVPYLQAFLDMGLIGGIYYLILQLIMPVKMILNKEGNQATKFFKLYAIMTITYNLYSGVPYGHYKFLGIILLFNAVDIMSIEKIKQIRGSYETN